ncbi:DUF1028 domain-containing protein [Salegentibacter salegens]|uniref:Uncharacterized conserved protein, Ntn-hydrolase superfamily n=1 Tax=Salegentibacter salegens TaxID=143223 RepID=A0A1M7M3H5_9FLAO|nr:DUF1028 domain-containing protein [Salegentibacter salegens]PRX40113.1 putative Ntn-hydrolase superfamily protein [Salegentibacter salegens]SHM85105.1 Uncharacterized conserved protein, Ntn-hydrolase superfamily [Salegentibacter salegens]
MKQSLLFFTLIFISTLNSKAQTSKISGDAFAHTYSIVARDAKTGEMAVGVQSHWFSVGPLVAWGKSGVGVVATQSFVNPAFGPEGLKLLNKGYTPEEAIETLINNDEGRDFRQLAILGKSGENAAYTGQKCVAEADHLNGDNFSVQANMMLNDDVVPAMAQAFTENVNLPLAERVVAVLKAAQNAGGDIRGKQSAALIVVGPDKVEEIWKDKKIDLRVDDHENPIQELDRLLKTARAYEFMNRGDLAMEEGNVEKALEEYGTAESMFPDNLEMRFWKAVALANSDRLQEAKQIFDRIFDEDENWRTMLKRLPKAGLIDVTKEELETLTK